MNTNKYILRLQVMNTHKVCQLQYPLNKLFKWVNKNFVFILIHLSQGFMQNFIGLADCEVHKNIY